MGLAPRRDARRRRRGDGLRPDQVERAYRDIVAKRRAAERGLRDAVAVEHVDLPRTAPAPASAPRPLRTKNRPGSARWSRHNRRGGRVKVPARFKAGITRYSAADADDLRDVPAPHVRGRRRQVDEARTAWLFDRNPCRTADDTRDIYVCRRDGAIVGQQAEIPFDLQVGGRERRAAWAVDLMVDDAWRLRGVGPGLVATQLDRRRCRRAQPVRQGLRHLRPRRLDRPRHRPRLPARPRPGRRGRAAPPRARPPGRAGRRPVLRAADAAVIGALRAAGARLVDADRFDERADEVWAAAAPHYPVLARRDLTPPAWRLDDRPDAARLQRYYLVVRGRPVGYVVLRAGGTAAAPTAVVVDYLAPPRGWRRCWSRRGGPPWPRGRGPVGQDPQRARRPGAASPGSCAASGAPTSPSASWCTAPTKTGGRPGAEPASWFVTSADSDLEYAMTPGTDAGAAPGSAESTATDAP